MKKILSWVFVLCLLLLIFHTYERFIFSFNFTDEGDNISIGKYLLQGKKLYQDIFSQHQPLAYYFSALIQKVSQPPNILMVVKRHRESIMLFSFSWIIFLTWRFGSWILLPTAVLELTKYYLLGHLFLAESLVIYPLIYLFLLSWQLLNKRQLSLKDCFIVSLSVFWVIFNLLPLAPAVSSLWFFMIWKQRGKKKKLIALILPLITATVFLFLLIPVASYLEDSIWANLFYYIPQSNKIAFQVEEPLWWQIIKIPFYPLLAFSHLNNPFFRLLAFLTSFLIISSFFHFKKKNKLILAFSILFLSNLRPAVGSGIYYHAFHSLPYMALFIFITFILVREGSKALFLIFCFLLFSVLFFDKHLFYWENYSFEDMKYIQFSRLFDASIAVKSMADKNDTLAVVPYEELLYWLPDVQPATRFLFYYSWVYHVPKFKKEIDDSLQRNPPTFVYWQNTCLQPYLKTEDYVNLPRDATVSAIFIHKNKLPKITDDQWKTLEYYRYNRINEKRQVK